MKILRCWMVWMLLGLGGTVQVQAENHARKVAGDQPVAYWPLNKLKDDRVASAHGDPLLRARSHGVSMNQAGPRAPRYGGFSSDNRAASFDGDGDRLVVADHAALRFAKGQTITIEAWVHPESLDDGQNMYVIGKGRTGRKGFSPDNQNWAMRLRGEGGEAKLSFLFRGAGEKGAAGWHRWTSSRGFIPGAGWHHLTVTYTFGKPDSIRGHIDGQPAAGTWDMGGASKVAPVVDGDEVWIGSSMAGNAQSSFHGRIDEVAVYRHGLKPDRIAERFRHNAPVPAEAVTAAKPVRDHVRVEVFNGRGTKLNWNFRRPKVPAEAWTQPAMGFAGSLPNRYTSGGVIVDRPQVFLLRATTDLELAAGRYRLVLRSLNGARLFVDGKKIAQTGFIRPSGSGHGKVNVAEAADPSMRPPSIGHKDRTVVLNLSAGWHRFELEGVIGGKKLRAEPGNLSVAIGPVGKPLRLLAPRIDLAVDEAGWRSFATVQNRRVAEINAERRRIVYGQVADEWNRRHAQARSAIGPKPTPPPVPKSMPVFNDVDRYLGTALARRGLKPTESIDDYAFIRRLSLDTRGIVPSPGEIAAFLSDRSPERRTALIDRFLADARWADHWTGYWQDVLAENPGIVKPKLNNSGPFRWWIHESLLDNKPMDRFVTELVMMQGSRYGGGPAGFEMASQNDVPMAAKAHILGTAFLGIELKCARCHDAPFHDLDQKQLFAMAAMLRRKPITVPKTSSIMRPAAEIRRMSVDLTLKPGQKVQPDWPFGRIMNPKALPTGWVRDSDDSRRNLAALITAPQNKRFARVLVNRIWKRLIGVGFVEPVSDWENKNPSHPGLLDRLAWELIHSGYDMKQVARLILIRHLYQRQAVGQSPRLSDTPEKVSFVGPMRRRLSAEQVVDSLFFLSGKPMDCESLTMDADGRRAAKDFLDLGRPTRAWQFCSLSNERDRPSLSMPRAQSVIDVLTTFGWRQARQDPLTVRDRTLTPLQPLIMANGTLVHRVVTFSDDSAWTALALRADQTPARLTADLFLRVLGRKPTAAETSMFKALLADGFDRRLRSVRDETDRVRKKKAHLSWSNHLSAEANRLKIEQERAVREGDPPTERLEPGWRRRAEDAVWALINSPEFLFVP
ncbi:MAG: DUF1553 domain-containing protein [Phycisphaeraceae bacterium]|nr:DUF1553 domain-containing protein [Phycisphaeraceae bacterium]